MSDNQEIKCKNCLYVSKTDMNLFFDKRGFCTGCQNAEYAKNNPSWQKDWQTYLKENGGGQITRNFSRILLKEW